MLYRLPRGMTPGGACMCAQVSDLTGSFRLYRKSVLQELVKDVASKGCAPKIMSPHLDYLNMEGHTHAGHALLHSHPLGARTRAAP